MSATGGSSSYVPKSPDLSSFYAGPEAASTSSSANYYALSHPSVSTSAYSLQPRAQAHNHNHAHAHAQAEAHSFSQPQPHQYNNSNSNTTTATTTITNHNAYQLSPQQHPPLAAYNNNIHHSLSPLDSLSPYPHQPGVQLYPHQQPQYPLSQQPSYHPQVPTAPPSYYPSYTDSSPSPNYLSTTQPLPQHQQAHRPEHQQPQHQPSIVFDPPTTPNSHSTMPRGKAAAQVAKEPEIMASPVRTKFPTARIKRIMQADEEVGKVAQQTPIAVGKALELFMVQLVQKSAEVAKDKNSKRITAPMLKQAIDSTNEWDFLRDIVAKVAEEKEGAKSSGRAKAESESEDEPDVGEVKKKGRGGRKKKAAA